MKWRATFSLRWYRQYCVAPSVLENTLRLLFCITEFPNESISVASFNAIGGLLVVLAPFHAEELIEALSLIISDLPPSPNTSISIVSTFVFLSHRVAPFRIDQFFRQFLITHYFSADIQGYYRYLPQLIRNMGGLPLDLHLALMQNLRRFGRDPT
jgi:hypothetical protein